MIGDYVIFESAFRTTEKKNTWIDWHLIPLTRPMIAPPAFKSNYVQSQAIQGEIDFSDMSGLNYSNRKGTWTFKLLPEYNFETTCAEIISFLHGGLFNIYLSWRVSTHRYKGRVTVTDWKTSDSGSYITLGYNVEPFADYIPSYVHETISRNASNASSSYTLYLPITRKPSIPVFKATSIAGSSITIVWHKCTYEADVNMNTHDYNEQYQVYYLIPAADVNKEVVLPDLVLFTTPGKYGTPEQRSGTEVVSLSSGSGAYTVEVTYQGGDF